MNTLRLKLKRVGFLRRRGLAVSILITLAGVLILAGVVYADVPGGKLGPRGTVPNPGTQQQELANITFPAPYNVFEFVVTCAACHGGTIDQQAGHFGNWAGTSMASAARDPVFRANQIGVEYATGRAGAGNMCFRCHSPNGWYSGRFDPTLAGNAEGRTMMHSIVLSTDDEGILCEFCHRAIGNVTMKRQDLDQNDPVWNMLAGVTDWPHSGRAYTDQAGDQTIAAGNPYGDTSLQINDGMTYIGKYSGSVDIYASDAPTNGTYTGQTYGIYPPDWPNAGQPVYNPDGSVPIHFEAPIGPPMINGVVSYQAQGLSLEHPTAGNRDGVVPDANKFLRSSEFCGSCHDLTVPVLNHGMPEQRTYTEWKFSDFGANDTTCQSCHMPTQKHEYSDTAQVSLNPDPTVSGWFPYAKDRNPQGGTAFHKFAGANRDLPMMMKELYPEPDLEVIGAPTGNDPTIFPGMLSNRDPMYDRAQRNTEVMLADAVSLEFAGLPTCDGAGNCSVQVKVTNNSGHRIPSGYPDGRRFWIKLEVRDENGVVVYESGHYDQDSATLFTDSSMAGFQRALGPAIDEANNAVMVYERVTGTCTDANGAAIFPDPTAGSPVSCTASPSLLNNFILFDNRILPSGFDYAKLRAAGVKFWNYGPDGVPYEDLDRFPNGQNWDLVTYTFQAPPGASLTARGEVYWQTHTREFMEHLRDQDVSNYRPEGPPNILDPNYPLNPTYLSDVINLTNVEQRFGVNLNDNWGGIAYASWLLTGKGAPYLAAMAEISPPLLTRPGNLQVVTANDAFTQRISWDPVAGADGYQVWIRYGTSNATASWDRLAIVLAPTTELFNTALNVGKTYTYQVMPFNGGGFGPASAEVSGTTPNTFPLPPESLTFVSSTATTITMSWLDVSDNEIGWIVYRQDVPPNAFFTEIARFPSNTVFGGVNFTDGTNDPGITWAAGYVPPQPGKCYNYVVEAYNATGTSGWNVNGPVQMCTSLAPGAPTGLTAVAVSPLQVDLTWNASTGPVVGYHVERSDDGGTTWTRIGTNVFVTSYSDTTVAQQTTYHYRVIAYNATTESLPSDVAIVTTPYFPAAPLNLTAIPDGPNQVTLTWSDNADNEQGFHIERCMGAGCTNFAWLADVNTPSPGTGGNVNYVDTGLTAGTTYTYRVNAFNQYGPGDYSNTAEAVTPGGLGPNAPSNLIATQTTQSRIRLDWTDNATNEQGFYIERLNANGWARIATVGANTRSYVDRNLTAGTYTYRVQAYNASGVSAFSNEATAMIQGPPAAPSNLHATNITRNSVTLEWNDNSTNETSFRIQRRLVGGNWSNVGSVGANVTTYTSTGLSPNRTYEFRVRALSNIGNSGYSNVLRVTTLQ